MKKIKYILAALVSFAALSCVELESPVTTPETNQDSGLVTLTLSTGEQTKTHISDVTNDGVTEIHWDAGDKIKVFTNEQYWNSNAFSFSMSETPNGNFASFSGKIAAKSNKIWAVYPEGNAKSCTTGGNGKDIVVSLPSTQSPVANSFAQDLNVSVAKANVTKVDEGSYGSLGGEYELTETIFVQFKNVCSLLKFTAPVNATEISSVTITANEDIAGDMTIDYSGETPVFAGIANGSKSITMTGSFVAGKDYYFVVAPVDLTGISMTIQANNETKYIVKKANIDLQPGVVKNLGSVNLEKMTKVSASAAHQYPDDVLSGTNVTFSGLDNVSSVNLTINQASGSAKRSVTSATSSYKSESDSAWPYLPQGAYTFSGSFSVNGVNVTVPATSFSVPAPEFTVNDFTAFTSYSKYLEKKSSANTLDGSAIYVNVTASIASTLLENSNYEVKVNDKVPIFKTVDDVKCAAISGNEWKSHDVTQIKWTFDGVHKTKTISKQTVNVTGIPFYYSFSTTNDLNIWDDVWALNTESGSGIFPGYYAKILGYEVEIGGIGLHNSVTGSQGFCVSPKFWIPDGSLTVVPTVDAYAWGTNTRKSYKFTIGPTSSTNKVSSNGKEFQVTCKLLDFSPSTCIPEEFTLTSTNQYFSIDSNTLSGFLQGYASSIYSVDLKYKL